MTEVESGLRYVLVGGKCLPVAGQSLSELDQNIDSDRGVIK